MPSSGLDLDLDDNFSSHIFLQVLLPQELFSFWSLFCMIWAARLLCACVPRTAFASRIAILEEGGCWLVLVASALRQQLLSPASTEYPSAPSQSTNSKCLCQIGMKCSVLWSKLTLSHCTAVSLLFSLSFPLHVLRLWSTCFLWPLHRNAFVILQAVRFYNGQELSRKPST